MVQEEKDLRTIPWCTICLTVGALTCHTLVLMGNLITANTFSAIGDSTAGWSNVGLSLATAMDEQLDKEMSTTVATLTSTLQMVVTLSAAINAMLGITANSTDEAVEMLQHPKLRTHPLILVENNDKIYYERVHHPIVSHEGVLLEYDRKKPLTTVSMLSFADIPSDGKLQIHLDGSANGSSPMMLQGAAALAASNRVLTWTPTTSLAVNVMTIKETLKTEVAFRTDDLVKTAHEFLEAIKPPLIQIGKWLISMGTKMMGTIQQFSMTIDKVQKIFDQIMSQVAGPPTGLDLVVDNTFNLFDLQLRGVLSLEDILTAGTTYGITCLQGSKAKMLFEKYDYDQSGTLTKAEYSDFVADPDIPSAVTYILRQFDSMLAQISGNLAAATLRDEVAERIVEYATLMGQNNRTKISWISERLTNGSLVMDITANIYKKMAENLEDPVQLTPIDVPQMIVDEFLHLNEEYALECFDLMIQPWWWLSQGFDTYKQAKWCAQTAQWIAKSPYLTVDFDYKGLAAIQVNSTKNVSLFRQTMKDVDLALNQVNSSVNKTGDTAEFAAMVGQQVHNEVFKMSRRHQNKRHRAKMDHHNSIFAAKSSSHIFKSLLGTATMISSGSAVPDADIVETLNAGVDATPATLEFAKFLSWNASQTATRFDGYAFDYAQTSSNVMQSFADYVKGMVDAVSGFMNEMMDYSTPRGISSMEATIMSFVKSAAAQAQAVVDKYVDDAAIEMFSAAEMAQIRSVNDTGSTAVDAVEDAALTVFSTVATLMTELSSILPTVIADLSFARIQVSAVAEVLNTIFNNFLEKGSPIFQMVASLYSTLWTVYYVFFAMTTLLILFYGFWATGWFGGPAHKEEAEPPQPTSCKERCFRCMRACNWCMHNVHNTHLCFWSCILLCEVVILVMFIVGIVLCVLSGIKVFLNIGCAQIYVLGDDTVCLSTMNNLRKFLATFWDDQPSDINVACDAATLTACKKIMALTTQCVIYTTGGSFAAALFSFQMLFESASLHEKARWLYLTDMAMQEGK